MNHAVTEALGNTMYRFTFGIIGDARFGTEGRGLATGIGILWKNTYLILTADHVIQQTPYERTYFLLPDECLQCVDSDIASQSNPINVRTRFALQKPKTICADNEDLAAFVVERQVHASGQSHFYRLDENHTCPTAAEQVGVLGYPGATTLQFRANYMATPYLAVSELRQMPEGFDNPESRVCISYPSDLTVDSHGLSGSGLWIPSQSAAALWTPEVNLIGLVTHHDPVAQALVGYRVEKLIEFLKANDDQMFG